MGDKSFKRKFVDQSLQPSGNLKVGKYIEKSKVNSFAKLKNDRYLLPIYKSRQCIINTVLKSDTLLLMGETGSGKTTQIPQFLLSAGFCKNKSMIGVVQPRRIAAVALAKRVAQEQTCCLGSTVGYSVRFEDCSSSNTRIRFLTDGVLLREALSDRLLQQYSVIMLDEVHERTVNTDVLFGIVKQAQRKRRVDNLMPLKVIVTSATMDIDHFSRYFGVPGMYLEGRIFPVRVMHVKESQADYSHSILVTIFDILRNTPIDHDILVFLTGQEEIEALAYQIRRIAKVKERCLCDVRVFPLYAQLPQNKQMDCFDTMPFNVRKIVLATNVAETSITIPGIRCVIDCGFEKRRIFNPHTGLQTLSIVRISQAQSWQRCGRAGRDAAGICYRTYTKVEMAGFKLMPKPEILRTNISSTVLQLLALDIDCRTFDFLDCPSPDSIDSAYRSLALLGALLSETDTKLTPIGKKMAQFPLDPQYSKLLLTASSFCCMEEMMSIVSLISSENIFIRNVEKKENAALAHAKFQSNYGDHLSLLNVYEAFQKSDNVKLWCHENFLNTRNLIYAREIRIQLLQIINRLNIKVNSCGKNYDQVRKCLLSGLFQNIAELQRDNLYITVNGRQRAKIHPSSVFHGTYKPKYVIFSDIIRTDYTFLHHVTEFNPEWITEIVPYLTDFKL